MCVNGSFKPFLHQCCTPRSFRSSSFLCFPLGWGGLKIPPKYLISNQKIKPQSAWKITGYFTVLDCQLTILCYWTSERTLLINLVSAVGLPDNTKLYFQAPFKHLISPWWWCEFEFSFTGGGSWRACAFVLIDIQDGRFLSWNAVSQLYSLSLSVCLQTVDQCLPIHRCGCVYGQLTLQVAWVCFSQQPRHH